MSRRLTHLLALALAAAALAVVPASALAAGPEAVNADCVEDEDLDGNYTNEEKKAALEQMPSEVSSYTDCEAIIASEIDNGGGPTAGIAGAPGKGGRDGRGGNGGGGSAGASKAGPSGAKAEALERQLARAETESKLGDRSFDPQATGAIDATGAANGLPLPVLLALIAVGLLLLSGAVFAVGRRNPALVDATLRRVPVPRRRG